MSEKSITPDDAAGRLNNLAALAYLALLGASDATTHDVRQEDGLYLSAACALREDMEQLAAQLARSTPAVA